MQLFVHEDWYSEWSLSLSYIESECLTEIDFVNVPMLKTANLQMETFKKEIVFTTFSFPWL